MGDLSTGVPKLGKTSIRKMVLVMGFMVFNVLVFDQFMGPFSRGTLSPLFPADEILDPGISSLLHGDTSNSVGIVNITLLNDFRNSVNSSVVLKGPKKFEVLNMEDKFDNHNKKRGDKLEGDDSADDGIDEFSFEQKKVRGRADGIVMLERVGEQKKVSREKIAEFDIGVSNDPGELNLTSSLEQINKPDEESPPGRHAFVRLVSDIKIQSDGKPGYNSSDAFTNAAFGGNFETLARNETFPVITLLNGAISGENFTGSRIPSIKRKMNMGFPVGYPLGLPPVYISEMDRLLVMNHNGHHSMVCLHYTETSMANIT